ncbi:hypothetical protein DL546_009223 [Coniochaeta pulveracea]|uniref:Uncharacterized protein n=1 Tax=Coniochaeta pulveracea TaxID=177199 RepID=A0A420YGU4_9PEZI|nr:hypothetical protein DL546_009223 [Coniochaeta pulveracea]
MYIPGQFGASLAGSTSAAARVGHDLGSDAYRELQGPAQPLNLDREYKDRGAKNVAHRRTLLKAIGNNRESNSILWKRDTLQSTNTTIGVVVGVLLAVFLVGAIYFCFRYRRSIRLSKRKKHRHHRSGGSSKGSNASQASDAPAPAPAPAPPPPPPPAPEG